MHQITSWFRSLKVAQKLMLITCFFVLPDSMMFYFFITGMNADIRFAELEKMGNQYQRPLEDLLRLIPEHRALVEPAALAGDLPALQSRIDTAFDALAAVDARIGVDLQFTDEGLAKRKREHFRAKVVRADWEELRAQLPTLDAATRAERHLRLIAAIRTMITHAGDNSNLILDPDLDTYYVMDATLLALPATQDRLAAVMAHAEVDLQQPTISAQERQRLGIHAALLQESDLDRIKSSLQTALNEDANFYGTSATLQSRLPPVLEEYGAAAEAVIALTKRLASAETTGITADEYRVVGQHARAASFKLWTVAAEELDALLQKRIEAFQFRRAKSMVIACLALLAAIGFVTFITRSISGPLQKQAEQLRATNESLLAEIAERRGVEEALRLAELRFRGLVEQLPAITYHAELGETCTWSYVSPQVLPLLGFTPEEWLASDRIWFEQVHPDDRAIPIEAEAIGLRTGQLLAEYRMFTRCGEIRWFRDQGVFVATEPGKHTIYGVMLDITEAKAADAHLEDLNQQLFRTSREAGMAEVATGVLHNVGNVLNSVNISAGILVDRLRGSKVPQIAKAAALLTGQNGNLAHFLTEDPQGQKLPGYFAKLGEHLIAENALLLGEADQLGHHIEHIKEVVAMQQSYAKVSGAFENLPLDLLVEDAIAMNYGAFERHGVSVERRFSPAPPARVDRHTVLQILINLIRNAKYALDEVEGPDKTITISIEPAGEHVHIRVADNGIGIPPENLDRIFAHGFTTRKEGHGFGLHSGANAAREIGGTLTVQSDGLGRGATFTLELPAVTEPNQA